MHPAAGNLGEQDEVSRRSAAALGTGLKILLICTFITAYLNPMLRPSEESVVTAYRLILPLVAGALLFRYIRRPVTQKFALYIAVVVAYSLAQMFVFGLFSDGFVWSYLINIVALILFIYFVYLYLDRYGSESLDRHLYFWYVVLIVASAHQLLTGFAYPNVPYREDVARIFFGQENDASLALAAFMPMLFARCNRDPLALLLLAAGVFLIYVNNTRGVLIAVAAYPVLLGTCWAIERFGRRIRPLRPLLAVLLVGVVAASIYSFRDTPIWLTNDFTSLGELLLDPLAEIA